MAQVRPLGSEASQLVIEGWSERLSEAESMLHEERWGKTRKRMNALLNEMASRLWSGPSSARLLARGSALRAIAYSGLGEVDEASWDWSVALALEPDLERLDLSRFGKAGELLGSSRVEIDLDSVVDTAAKLSAGDPESDLVAPEITPPKKIRSPAPGYPRAKYYACKEEPIVVVMIIDVDGRPKQPRLVGEGDPVLFFSATETLRDWKFEPARVGETPVTVYYNLTVNYRRLFCKGTYRDPGG